MPDPIQRDHEFEPLSDPEWGIRYDLCAFCLASPQHHDCRPTDFPPYEPEA